MLRRIAAVAAAGLLLAMALSGTAAADSPVQCMPGGNVCVVVVTDPGTPTRPGDPARPRGTQVRAPRCTRNDGSPIACFDPVLGSWDNSTGCYQRLVDPQPPKADPIWGGHTDGAIWHSTCLGGGGIGGGEGWLPGPPPGVSAGGPTPGELAQDAVSQLVLEGPDIGSAPRAGGTGLVGLPVWLWTAVTPQTWGPQSATAAVPGLSVTATARAAKVVWSMGDGATVACTKPGTPYARSRGAGMSPDCGYRYLRSSAGRPGGVYEVTATTTWQIDWAGGGESGQLTETRDSTTTLRIGELQVLVS